jgi:hypothetical protein
MNISEEAKLTICEIMEFKLMPAASVSPSRGPGWIFIYQPSKNTGTYLCGPFDGGWESKDQAVEVMWSHCIKRFELYLHKKGGIYRKMYEALRATPAEPIPVVVYEHLWPHQIGTWVRDKEEFESPGRFERIL